MHNIQRNLSFYYARWQHKNHKKQQYKNEKHTQAQKNNMQTYIVKVSK